MAQALVNQAGIAPDEVAFFTQRDGYGDAGYSGGVDALTALGLADPSSVAHGRYERNTLAVEGGLAEILSSARAPRAVIMVGAYAPCAEFIRLCRSVEFEPLFLNVSFVGSAPLARELGSDGEGVIVTQVVPQISGTTEFVRAYKAALHTFDEDLQPSFGSLEGYIVGRILCRALRSIEGPIDREGIVDALEGLGEFDLGLGAPLTLSKKQHQASNTVWPTVIRSGRVVPFDWSELAKDSDG